MLGYSVLFASLSAASVAVGFIYFYLSLPLHTVSAKIEIDGTLVLLARELHVSKCICTVMEKERVIAVSIVTLFLNYNAQYILCIYVL